MIQIQQLKLPVGASEEALRARCARELRCDEADIDRIVIRKRSIDARKKPQLFYIYTVHVSMKNREAEILKRAGQRQNIGEARPVRYAYDPAFASRPTGKVAPAYVASTGSGERDCLSPVVVGMGPAGLFCAYLLALYGQKPILLERGRPADQRQKDVEAFWRTGVLDPVSNVQFGEGGAGTFSDGKLNTLVKDKLGRNRFVLETFVKFGAPEDILIDAKPHIGTDLLVRVVANMRREIRRLGGQIRFSARVDGICVRDGRLTGVRVGDETIPCRDAVFAIGHSARDTFSMLLEAGVAMQAKEFAVGFRIEHPQIMIDESQYGSAAADLQLPPAPYKLATKLANGRGVYSFCMCPGGYVVNASSQEGRLVVNGMSYADRGSKNANSAIVVSVGKGEFSLSDPMGAVAYQKRLEEQAFSLCAGKIPQQLFGDYKRGKVSASYGSFLPKTKGAADFGALHTLLSAECRDSLLSGMELFGKKIRGFDRDDAILSGIESRTSSPVRIPRDERFCSNVEGLYPCGEGAGYAGGIMSAAMDGLKTAEKMLQKYEMIE